MTGGSERGAGDRGGTNSTAQVPIGWRRTVDNGAVAYISPSGTILSSVEEVGSYLLTDGTCKCGLECPLVVHKVFNFDPRAVQLQRAEPLGKAEEDMTKLCNHRRKVVAMAALCRSMQASQLPTVSGHSPGGPFCTMESRDLRVGPLGAREDGGWGSYPPRHRPSAQPKLSPGSMPPHPPLAFPFNGALPLSRPSSTPSSRLSPRKPPPPSPSRSSFPCYGPPQRYQRPATPQNLLQNPRPAHTPEPPGSPRLGPHSHLYSADPSLSSPPSSSPSPGAMGAGRVGAGLNHQPIGSPPPFSSSPSPSRSQDSPRQRSRHSSTSSSSLSEQGAGVVLAAYPPGSSKPPCPAAASPKGLPHPPVSPRSRLEGMLQQFKDSGPPGSSGSPQSHPPYATLQSNQSNLQLPQNHLAPPAQPPHFPSDRKSTTPTSANANISVIANVFAHTSTNANVSTNANAYTNTSTNTTVGTNVNASPNAIAFASPNANAYSVGAGSNPGFLGQLLSQQKQHPHASPFPASSLLSAAAKAQLASQKSQSPSHSGNPSSPSPGAGSKEAPQPKVLISTLHSSARTPPAPHALLVPHSSPPPSSASPSPSSSSSSPRGSRPLLDKAAAQRKRQRRSPTVLSMLKESQLNCLRAAAAAEPPSFSSTSLSLNPPPENHLQPGPAPGVPGRQPADAADGKRGPAQPLSALLHLLSLQSAAQASPAPSQTGPASAQASPAPAQAGPTPCSTPSSPGPTVTLPTQFQAPPTSLAVTHQPLQSFAAPTPLSPQSFTPMGVAEEVTDSQNHAPGPLLTLGHSPGTQDVGGQILSLLGQLSSCPCPPSGPPLEERGAGEPSGAQLQGPDLATGPLVTLDPQDPPETPLPGTCSPALALPPSPGETASPLQLAESFPLMSQDQLLQLLSSHSLLAPPFLGSLPIGLWMGGGTQAQAPPQTPPPATPHQQQASQLNILPSVLGAQGELSVNLLGLLNGPPPGATPGSNPPPGDLGGEKSGALQALLTASLLLGQQNSPALLPLAGLAPPLDLLLQQQPFPAPLPESEGVALEKAPPTLPDSGPGVLEALQSLLLPPPPPAFLSLSPALLAAALGLPDTPNSSQQPLNPAPPPAPAQVTLSSPALGSTSVSCASLIPSPAPDVSDAMTNMPGQGKTSALTPNLLPPLLPPGVLGDLAALGNIGSLHGMMGTGPLLLPPMQAPGLGMPLLQAQASGLNPLACLLNNLQLHMGPTLSMGGEKPMGMQETSSPAPQDNISANPLAQEPVPAPSSQALGPQRDGAPGGLLDPYGSFMDTIYTSFLQVSGRSPEGGGDSGDTPLPPLSPRRACSLRNPDLSRLGMEAAHSPARGTPKLSGESSPALSLRLEPPAPPDFPEEAKTDSTGSAHPYSNGLLCEGEGQGQGEGLEGYHGPPEGVNGTAENHMEAEETEEERGPTVRTGGARRGRKRKQVLPRETEGSREMDTGVSEEPIAMMVLQKPERSVKSKRRRVFR